MHALTPRKLPVTALGLALILGASSVRADAQSAAAEALFEEARKLVQDGRVAEACPKFQESQRLDPGVGTLYNLADCWERMGKTASAWGAFLEASHAARSAGQTDRERVAKQRADALAPRLARMMIVVAQGQPQGFELKRDATVIGSAQWGTAVPVDPGSHRIEASAPGARKWETTVDASAASTTTVSVPLIELERPQAQKSAPTNVVVLSPKAGDATNSEKSSQRLWAGVLGGVGLVGVAVGSVYGLRAKSKNDDSMAFCREKTLCSSQGVSLRDDARSAGNISTITLGLGAAAIAGGVVLWATAPTGPHGTQTARLRAVAGPTIAGANVGLEGVW